MHPLASDLALYSPDTGSESSFPERHLEDDIPAFSNIDLNFSQPTLPKPQSFDSSFWSQSWLGQTQSLLDRNHIPPHLAAIEHAPIIADSFRTAVTTSPVQAEWDLFRATSGHSPGGFNWSAAQGQQNLEDDSDSINDSLEEFCPPVSTWPTAHSLRRRSTHRVSKPSRLPVTQSLQIVSDSHMFLPQPSRDRIVLSPDSAAADITLQEEPLESKLHSKRVAHKLSEKSRRNRLTVAIREIQKLLPSESETEDSPRHDIDLLVRPGVPTSKLDVVEMAVGFIKKLKEENVQIARKLKEMEEKQKPQESRRQQEDKEEKGPGDDTISESREKEASTTP